MINTIAIIACAGKSTRMRELNKLTAPINNLGITVLEKSFLAFYNHPKINKIIFSTSNYSIDEVNRITNKYTAKPIEIVSGGKTRHESTKKALNSIKENCDIVLFHDGARPYLSQNLISHIIENSAKFGSAIPYINSSDSLYNNKSNKYIDRNNIKKIQTPQGFKYDKIKQAFDKSNDDFSDEGTLYQKFIAPIKLVEGEKQNIKITTQDDLYTPFKVGIGYDVHKLVENRKLLLGGIEIPFNKGLLGHSDADVLIHAIMDSLLGGAGLRDIGVYFPDTDPQYKNISSLILLKKVKKLLANQNIKINNINCTLLIQKPKIANYIPKMISRIAETLNIDKNRISISATTTEGLGIIGEEKGIACYCVSSLIKNKD